MAAFRGCNQASFPPSNSMSPSANDLPSPSIRIGFSHKPDQSLASTHENGSRPSDSSDSDSDSSLASDRHLPYTDNPRPNTDPHLQLSKEKKGSRRKYFDYGITTSSHPVALSSTSKFEDTYTIPTSYSFPWELPPPSIFRTAMPHRVDNDKDLRTEPPSFYHSQPFWLILYFFFNLGLTLYNKAVLIHFPYAYALTALHALCGSIGGFVLLRLGVYVPAKLTDADNMALLAFSLLYTINIAVSNLSLELVTIPVSPIGDCILSLL